VSPKEVLKVKGLKKHFTSSGRTVKALDGVSFSIYEGETLGLVGELGSGKTTLAYTVSRVYEPTSGEVCLGGKNLFKLSKRELRKTRVKMQLIFSNPYTSLNPRLSLFKTLSEPLIVNNLTNEDDNKMRKRISDTLEAVGLKEYQLPRYPHEFSGGQRQRIAIARALIVEPELLLADEPIIALDTSVKASVLNLFKTLKSRGFSCLYISNSFGEIRFMSERIAVMYRGRFVEVAAAEDLFSSPYHPYTKHLLAIEPVPDPDFRAKLIMKDVSRNPPKKGCKLWKRCPYAKPECKEEEPELLEVAEGHYVACCLCR
jgi:oligopeptide/dipeptide ABC transporter ATP-binding protein